jgi:ElaB/YqjD/DUF883 family membrane-anchored ribosome-binding protein
MAENLTTDPTLTRPESLAATRAVPVDLDRRAQTDPEHLLPEHTSPGEPGQVAADDPDTARAEIGRTRARMSATLDSIEAALVQRKEALVRRKEAIQERLDVMAPVRERPLLSVGLVFGAALVLGYATGDDDEEEHGRGAMAAGAALVASGAREEAQAQAHTWKKRARKMLKRTREQQEELHDLRSHVGDDLSDGLHAFGVGASHLRDMVAEGVADLLTAAFDGLRQGAHAVREVSEDVAETVGDRFDDLKDRVESLRD